MPALSSEIQKQHHRERYLGQSTQNPDSQRDYQAINHTSALNDLLSNNGFTVQISEQGDIADITWPQERLDFILLDMIADHIWNSVEVSDEEYLDSIFPQIEAVLQKHSTFRIKRNDVPSFFQRLNDDSIPRSPAHKRNPFGHTLDVARGIDTAAFRTDSLGEEQKNAIFAARFQAFVHDWGKLMIADGDVYQYHAEISYLLFKKYVDSRVKRGQIRLEQVDSLLQPIRYHHIFELVSKGVFDLEEVLGLLVTDKNAYILLGVLAAADGGSIEGYGHFTLENINTFFQGLEAELAEVLAQLPNFAQTILKWFDSLLGSIETYLGTNPGDKKTAQVTGVRQAEINKLLSNAALRILLKNADIREMRHLSANLSVAS